MNGSAQQQQKRRMALMTGFSTRVLQKQQSIRITTCELEEMKQMKLEIAELRTSLDDSQHIANQHREENRRLRSKLAEATEECDTLKTRLSTFKSKMLQMKSVIDELKQSRTEMSVRLEAAESEAVECRNRSRQLMQSNECLMDERDMLSSMVDEDQKPARPRGSASRNRRSTRLGHSRTAKSAD